MTAVLTLLTSVAAYLSIWALIAVRVAEGFFEVSGDIDTQSSKILIDFCCLGSHFSCNACYLGEMGTTSGEKHTHYYYLRR